jgi:hypothetical protein
MKKFLQVFFTPPDEQAFEQSLRALVPDLRIVDECYWPSPAPPVVQSISACTGTAAYLWSPAVSASLPSRLHTDGVQYHGPQSGVVIQFVRCRLKGDTLNAGQLSVGYSEPNSPMKQFAALTWKALNSVSSSALVAVDPSTRAVIGAKPSMVRAGHDAIAWCKSNSARAFSCGSPFIFLPASEPNKPLNARPRVKHAAH